MSEPIGQILDNLGCRATLADGDLVAGAIIILKIVDSDGDVRLSCHWSDGLWQMERLGMLHAAVAIETPEPGDALAD